MEGAASKGASSEWANGLSVAPSKRAFSSREWLVEGLSCDVSSFVTFVNASLAAEAGVLM